MSSKAQVGNGLVLAIGSVTTTPSGSETFIPTGEIVSIDLDGGSRTINDTTNMSSTHKEKLGGLPDDGKVTLTLNRLAFGSDPGVAALYAAWASGLAYDFKMTLVKNTAATQTTLGDVAAFSGIVSNGPAMTFAPDKVVQQKWDFETSNGINWTAGS